MEFKDYYKILGVQRNASADQIRAAYRRLARRHHPDVNPGDAQSGTRFKEINEAYEVLHDPEKRKRYDAFGSNWRRTGSYDDAFRRAWADRGRVRGAGPGFGGVGGGGSGFSDFFDALFRGMGIDPGSGGARGQPPADLEEPLDVALDEVASGGTRVLTVQSPGTDGAVRTRRVEVSIPKGVPDGQRLRIAGEGGVRADGTRGDLFLRVRTAPDPHFERDGADLITELEIGLTEALLGVAVRVRGLSGRTLEMRVPPETRDGAVLRLRGQGLPVYRSSEHGDLRVRMRVRMPTHLTERERHLFSELAALRGEHPLTA